MNSATEQIVPQQQIRREFLKACGAIAGATFLNDLSMWAKGGTAETKPGEASHRVRFGWTDLYVSRLCQGTAFRTMSREPSNPEGQRVLHRCMDLGINFFDTAEIYGYGSNVAGSWGSSELTLGKAIAGRRDKLVLCTKANPRLEPPAGTPAQRSRFTREVLFRKAEGSLKRLGTDYVDLFLLHEPDDITPPEEIAQSMNDLVTAGKIRYWGVSNYKLSQVAEFIGIGKRAGKSRIAGLEDEYNVAGADQRVTMERKMFPLIRKGKLGLMAYSPLAAGLLAPGRKVEAGSTLEALVSALDKTAKQLGVTRPQVCIAWVLTHPQVTAVLAGAERPEHVEENFSGTQLVLPSEMVKSLNAVAANYSRPVVKN